MSDHGHIDPSNKKIALLIAVLALILAFSETLAKSAQTSALSYTIEASNLWSFFQAKTIRMTTVRTAMEAAETELKQTDDPAKKGVLQERIESWKMTAARFDSEPETQEGRKELMARAKIAENKRTQSMAAYHHYELASAKHAVAVALPLGVIAACRPNSWFDQATTLFVFFGFAMPSFWLALLLILFFGVYLDWLPISGLTSLNFRQFTFWQKVQDLGAHVTLPVLGAAFMGLAGMSRYMRGSMLEVIRQDYITTARAKGLPERVVIFKHALRNALLPVITLLGLSVPGLIGGSVIFESIFAIPGMGQLFYGAVMARDYSLVMGELVIGAVLTLLGNMLADLGYALADPRIRTG